MRAASSLYRVGAGGSGFCCVKVSTGYRPSLLTLKLIHVIGRNQTYLTHKEHFILTLNVISVMLKSVTNQNLSILQYNTHNTLKTIQLFEKKFSLEQTTEISCTWGFTVRILVLCIRNLWIVYLIHFI